MQKNYELDIKTLLVLSAVLVVVISLLIFGCNRKDHRDYVQIFEKNRDHFISIKNLLAQIDGEYIVEITKADTVILKDEKTCTLNSIFDADKSDDITKFMSELEILAINKREDQIEFVFANQPDTHGILFVLDTQWMNSYTSVQDLGDGWFYFFFLHE